MQIVEELELGRRGAGINVDTSDNLEDMSYAEKAILRPEVLKAISELTVAKEDGKGHIGPVLVLDRTDVPEYDGKYFSGAANKINQIFTYLEIPYFASGLTRKDQPERLQIIKTGDKYNIDLYNVDKSKKTKTVEREVTVIVDGVETKKKEMFTPSSYHEATDGMKARIDKWIDLNGADIAEYLKALGMDVTIKTE